MLDTMYVAQKNEKIMLMSGSKEAKKEKRTKKRLSGLDANIFKRAIMLLQTSGTLPVEYRPHKLSGKYAGYWECHLQPDWLMIWLQDDHKLLG